MDKQRKLLSRECWVSLINSMLKFSGYRERTQKCTRNKNVPVYMVCDMHWKCSERITIAAGIEEVQYYQVYIDYHYLIQW